jgi:lactate 2-monooxygenase
VSNYGNLAQFEIYQSKYTGKSDTSWPIAYEEWEQKARQLLEDGPFHYVAGGAGSGDTMRENLAAFRRWRIVPQMLRDVSERNLTVHLLGNTYPTPILLAPIGVQSIVHPDGELAAARAAAASGIPYIASTASSYTMEEIANVMGDAPRWFQLYWGKDQDVTVSMLKRAEASGYSALVVTLDTQLLSWREDDLKNRYLPFLDGIGIANYISDPAFCSRLKRPPQEDKMAAIQYWLQIFSNTSLTWKDLRFLQSHTKLPILLKGILSPSDAKLALEHGANGIIVSNHGGRQVDGAIAALDALPAICEVVQGAVPVLLDSGIRRGSDVIKALALGAKAVLLGRPYIYGLAVGGEEGVKLVIRNLLADLDLTLALCGKRSLSELDRSLLVHTNQI